jgi:hypothetical protein
LGNRTKRANEGIITPVSGEHLLLLGWDGGIALDQSGLQTPERYQHTLPQNVIPVEKQDFNAGEFNMQETTQEAKSQTLQIDPLALVASDTSLVNVTAKQTEGDLRKRLAPYQTTNESPQ